jgi:DNA gyrase subunit A
MVVVRPDSTLLVVSEKGLGKRTEVEAYRLQGRGGSGVINLKTSARTGKVVAMKSVQDDEQLMVITRNGVVNRQDVAEISLIGRATQGVKLVNLDAGDTVVDVARVIVEDEDEEAEEALEVDAVEPAVAEGGDEA